MNAASQRYEAVPSAEHVDVRGQGMRRLNRAHANPASLGAPFETLVRLVEQGKIKHLGISNANLDQVRHAQTHTPIAEVQNLYSLGNTGDDDLIEELAGQGIAYVPFFPLLGVPPSAEADIAAEARAAGVPRTAVILARLLKKHPNLLVIPGTGSVTHLEEPASQAAARQGRVIR
ncbi:MAG: aldo/keto reductase [Actinomycetota bacterium]|jgi:aryl-alcohol dehydrogenase-like predicted oxidoreductase|nr:aldo/keto reductase [Actinomycetota bacterium]